MPRAAVERAARQHRHKGGRIDEQHYLHALNGRSPAQAHQRAQEGEHIHIAGIHPHRKARGAQPGRGPQEHQPRALQPLRQCAAIGAHRGQLQKRAAGQGALHTMGRQLPDRQHQQHIQGQTRKRQKTGFPGAQEQKRRQGHQPQKQLQKHGQRPLPPMGAINPRRVAQGVFQHSR